MSLTFQGFNLLPFNAPFGRYEIAFPVKKSGQSFSCMSREFQQRILLAVLAALVRDDSH